MAIALPIPTEYILIESDVRIGYLDNHRPPDHGLINYDDSMYAPTPEFPCLKGLLRKDHFLLCQDALRYTIIVHCNISSLVLVY